MIDFNDMQKPLVAVLALGAATTVGFVAGYIVGRDPETARKLARSMAGGLTRTQVVFAEAMENIGDLWAEARAEARRDIDDERFAAESVAVEGGAFAAEPRRRKAAAKQRRTTRTPRAAKSRRKAAVATA